MKKTIKHERLQVVIDDFQSHGRYWVTETELKKRVPLNHSALYQALHRLMKKKRVLLLKKGFYLIVPIEYRAQGILPPEWFIDSLMKYLGVSYYVGLLSAASIHGASHQQPMKYQVLSEKYQRPIIKQGLEIHFSQRPSIKKLPIIQKNLQSGIVQVSSIELTVLDLLLYPMQSGGLDNVATIYTELGKEIDPKILVETIERDPSFSRAHCQRLGYIFEKIGLGKKVEPLYKLLKQSSLNLVPLRPDRPWKKTNKNAKWQVAINSKIEAEQ